MNQKYVCKTHTTRGRVTLTWGQPNNVLYPQPAALETAARKEVPPEKGTLKIVGTISPQTVFPAAVSSPAVF